MKTIAYRTNCMQCAKTSLRRRAQGRMIENNGVAGATNGANDGETFPPSLSSDRNDAGGNGVRRRANAENQARFREMRALFADVPDPWPRQGRRDRGHRIQFRQ